MPGLGVGLTVLAISMMYHVPFWSPVDKSRALPLQLWCLTSNDSDTGLFYAVVPYLGLYFVLLSRTTSSTLVEP